MRLRPDQPKKQGPSQHIVTQPSNELRSPDGARLTLIQPFVRAAAVQRPYQRADERRAHQIEGEAVVGLQPENSGGDAEDGGREVLQVAEGLRLVS